MNPDFSLSPKTVNDNPKPTPTKHGYNFLNSLGVCGAFCYSKYHHFLATSPLEIRIKQKTLTNRRHYIWSHRPSEV